MLSSLRNIFKVPDLRNKVLFTILIIVLYRFGAHLPVPGIDTGALKTLRSEANQSGVLGFLTLFSGGAITNFAIFALGIMPYITASIIMQILGVVIPKLEEWQEQGAVGQRKITQWTRVRHHRHRRRAVDRPGVPVPQGRRRPSAGQHHRHRPGAPLQRAVTWLLIVLTLTTGTALLMWMGELITQRGIGNGMSLLIFASVVSTLPSQGTRIQAAAGWSALIVTIIVFMHAAGGHRVHRAGPAPHPGAVRQTRRWVDGCTAARAPTSRSRSTSPASSRSSSPARCSTCPSCCRSCCPPTGGARACRASSTTTCPTRARPTTWSSTAC